MTRWLYALLVGLIGAGIVHIVGLLLIPSMTPTDAWARLADKAGLYAFAPYESHSMLAAQSGIDDPLFRSVACRFDLNDGFARVLQPEHAPFWSASVYDRQGHNIYSMNDRITPDGRLDLIVVTPAQMVEIRKSPSPDMEKSVFVEAPIGEGIIVVRIFQPDATWDAQVAAFLKGITCTPAGG